MKVIEKKLAINDAVKIFDIIEETLKENRNTQIFVNIKFIDELRRNGIKHNVYYDPGRAINGRYYEKYDENSVYYLTHNTECAYGELINRACFTSNSDDYEQIVEFWAKDFETYLHFCEGCEQFLVIDV